MFSPFLYGQQETIISVGKSFISINPWDCLVVGVKILSDKLNLNILPIEVKIIKFFYSLEINESIICILFFNFVIAKDLLLTIMSLSNKTFLNLPSEFKIHK